MTHLPLLIPLACAFLYVLAALMLKRASELGVGVWRIGFLANWVMFLFFLPWWLSQPGEGGQAWTDYWQPAVSGLLFLGGQMFIFLALQTGDVSVTTPVMGTKVIMVALLSHLLRAGIVPWQWWTGAVLSASAVALLHFGEPHGHRSRVGRTACLAAMSALSFSLSDVLLQKWAGGWGTGRYLPAMFLFNALYTFAFVPFFRAPLRALDRRAWTWTLGGAVVLALNNAGIALAIAVWRTATAINILYSLRGLISIVLVWAIGHWFHNEEKHLAPRVFRFRLVGAGLMLAAIVLVLA
ncbi:MAG TPA: DMT family transporter [Lacunisphaera sp.]|nr:DMT family transporter [Lacunisphaera sp.]